MSIKHSLLAATYYPLRAINKTVKLFSNKNSGRLRVLIYHDVSLIEKRRFSEQLKHLSKSWQFVDPTNFSMMMNGELPVEKDSLLLTFDDGFTSCKELADSVLGPLNIKALFFIVSEFVTLNKNEWREFVATNINIHMHSKDIPDHCQNMSIKDLLYLVRKGHTLGAHTATHARLSQLTGDDLVEEIIKSANRLEKQLSISIDHFAYTFGNLDSFSKDALAVARQRFHFIHTGLRGDNNISRIPWAICRDSIKPQDSNNLIGAFLEGGADHLYAKDIEIYRQWGA